MKLIEEHNNVPGPPWFTGKKVTCDYCGSIWMLEATDTPYDYWSDGQRVVSFSCKKCGLASARKIPV